jgi:hypothetical protein
LGSSEWTITADLDPWRVAAGAALLLYALWAYRRTLPPLPISRRSVLAALRITGFALLVFFALDPSVITRDESSRQPVVPVLVDVSESMSMEDGDGRPRIDEARDAAARITRSLEGARVEILPFAAGLSGGAVPWDSIPAPSGVGTDIRGSVEAAERRYADDNLAAIVIISDGRVTRGMDGEHLPVHVPILAVAIGDTAAGVDLSIERLEYERTVFTGTRESVRAVIRYSSAGGRAAAVELIGDGRVLDRVMTGPLTGNGLAEARLRYVPSREGLRSMEVRVLPLEGEVTGGNNSEMFRVNALKDRVEILFFDASPDWNMTFLRRMCGGSKRLHLETAAPGPDGVLRTPEGGKWTFPTEAGRLSAYDLVIAGGGGSFPSAGQAEALTGYIATGGAVLFLASERSPLLSQDALALLRKALPVVPEGSPRIIPGDFQVIPGPTGKVPWLPDMSTRKDGTLPPLPGAVEGLAPAAGAVVPLVLTGNGPGRPFLVVEQKEKGISAALLGFPVWRWRLAGREGADAWEGLFGGLIQYLAEGRKAPAIDVQTDRTAYRSGETPRVTVYPSTGRAGEDMRGEVISGGSDGVPVETFIPAPDPDVPGAWTAVLGDLPAGDYSVRVRAGGGDGVTAQGSASFAVEALSVEMLRTSADTGMLGRLAYGSGGRVVRAGDVEKMAGMIDLREETVVTTSVRKIRGKFILFALIVLVFACEWLLRKFLGLV